MFRLIGSFMIIFSCSGIGFSKSNQMQCHLKDLEEVKKIFYLIQSEMLYTKAPFAELFEKIARKTDNHFKKWLENLCQKLKDKTSNSFWEIWKESIDEDLKDTYLKPEDFDELKSIGKNLEYTEGLKVYLDQQEYKISQTREIYRTKQKLYRSLGIMGGIFLVILLL